MHIRITEVQIKSRGSDNTVCFLNMFQDDPLPWEHRRLVYLSDDARSRLDLCALFLVC